MFSIRIGVLLELFFRILAIIHIAFLGKNLSFERFSSVNFLVVCQNRR